ncbi:MAG: hypothetical protein NTW56_04710 [Alphaproteobacteria bacterium]|jgi:hypothetical protein|nr:hypothetical protein [Alphaproteobacteria bacterium]
MKPEDMPASRVERLARPARRWPWPAGAVLVLGVSALAWLLIAMLIGWLRR